MSKLVINPADFFANVAGVDILPEHIHDKVTITFPEPMATTNACVGGVEIEVNRIKVPMEMTIPFILGSDPYLQLVAMQRAIGTGDEAFVRIAPRRSYTCDGITITQQGDTSGVAGEASDVDAEPLTIRFHNSVVGA